MSTFIAFIRSLVHMLWMILTVIPVAIWMVAVTPFASSAHMYKAAQTFLWLAMHGLRVICGVSWKIHGAENLPTGQTSPAILLLKHQSTALRHDPY
jgi:1-acyl-sn-glycerol-3-phosphate acyltransferase